MANATLFGFQAAAFDRVVNVWRKAPGKDPDGTATFTGAVQVASDVACQLWDTTVPNAPGPAGGLRELTPRNAPKAGFALGQDVQTGDYLQEVTPGLAERWRITTGDGSVTKYPTGGGSLLFDTAFDRDPR